MSSQALALSCSLLVAALACQSTRPPDSPSAPDPSASSTPAPVGPAAPADAPAPTGDSAVATTTTTAPTLADAGAGEASPPQTLFVRERRAECQGEAPMKCLQVRSSASEPWRNLYTTIEGFRYEEGNAYELRVEVATIPYPAMDASSLRYRLLEIVSKEPATARAP